MIRKIRFMILALGYLIEVSERGVTCQPSEVTLYPKKRFASRYYFTFFHLALLQFAARSKFINQNTRQKRQVFAIAEGELPIRAISRRRSAKPKSTPN